MERRLFLEQCGAGCLWLLGLPLLVGAGSCTSLIMVHASMDPRGVVRIPLDSLPADDHAVLRVDALRDDVLLVKRATGEWHALLMRCSHQDQPLTAIDGGLACSSHGSRFDLDGIVTRPPASRPLQRFDVLQGNGELILQLTKP